MLRGCHVQDYNTTPQMGWSHAPWYPRDMLRIGSRGPEVSSWQGFLASMGDLAATPDGAFGPATDAATRAFQRAEGLDADGVVGPDTYRTALARGWIPAGGMAASRYEIVPARWFTPGTDDRDVSLVVVHTTEGPRRARQARNTAAWFADERSRGSAHYVVDPELTVQCVLERDVAWHSGHKPTNLRSIGIEHCGRADQTPEDWADEASVAELRRSAELVADACSRHSVPAIWLTVEDLRTGGAGICGHRTVTDAFNAGKGHVDPGPSFPVATYLDMVESAMKAR